MSDLNVKAVKDIYAAFLRADLAGILSHVAADVEWSFEGPSAISYTGKLKGSDQVARNFFGNIAANDATPSLEMTEFIAQGNQVAVFGRYAATVKSGQRFDTPVAHFWEFRDGKVVRFQNISNTASYLAALGVAA